MEAFFVALLAAVMLGCGAVALHAAARAGLFGTGGRVHGEP